MGQDPDWLTEEKLAGNPIRISAATYARWFDSLPDDFRKRVEEHWGAAPGELYVESGDIVVAALRSGHVVLIVQPPRPRQNQSLFLSRALDVAEDPEVDVTVTPAATAENLRDLTGDEVLLGVLLGLVVGKPLGILGATWIGVRLRLGSLPTDTRWPHMVGVGVTAGIGFTVALFITSLAFADPALTSSAKTGVLLASLLAGVAGFAVLRVSARSGRSKRPTTA